MSRIHVLTLTQQLLSAVERCLFFGATPLRMVGSAGGSAGSKYKYFVTNLIEYLFSGCICTDKTPDLICCKHDLKLLIITASAR